MGLSGPLLRLLDPHECVYIPLLGCTGLAGPKTRRGRSATGVPGAGEAAQGVIIDGERGSLHTAA